MAKYLDRGLLGAFGVSMLAHLLLIAGPGWALPEWQEERLTRIDARLAGPVPITAPEPEAKASPPSPPAPRRPSKPKPRPTPKAQPAPSVIPPEPPPPVARPEPLAAIEPIAQSDLPAADGVPADDPAHRAPPAIGEEPAREPVVGPQLPEEKQENVTDAGADEELPDNGYPGPIPLPREARIAFSLILGRIQVGEALQTWSRDERGYRLRIVMETTGAARMFKALTITQTSAGGFYSGGLRPRRFSYEQTGRATSNTVFDWKHMKLTLARGDKHREYPLDVGAQDLLSLAYQLALAGGEARQAQVAVASGKNYYSNSLEWSGEDVVTTPSGDVRAVHVRTAGHETATEIWLAPGLQNLPVRIMFTDRSGTATQLIATHVEADGQTLLGQTRPAQ